jgi:general stress protein 26
MVDFASRDFPRDAIVAFDTEVITMEHDSDNAGQHNEAVEKVREMISDIKVAILTTMSADGQMHGRPMYTQETEFDGDIWFATSKSSALVAEIQQKSAVHVNYANPGSQRFVIIAGEATLVDDQAKKEELWNPALKPWFAGGVTDPEYTLVKIESHSADYWDSPIAPVRWFQFLAGVATGKRPAGDQRGAVNL